MDSTLSVLIDRALERSDAVAIRQLSANQQRQDRYKAWQSYLPNIKVNSRFTHLDAPVELPDDMQSLLMGTQKLLVKEKLNVPFNQDLPPRALGQLEPVPAIQDQDTWRVDVEAEMVLFSGLKIPNLARAARHGEQMYRHMSRSEQVEVIKEVISTYDRLALIYQSSRVLDETARRLDEQVNYVTRAVDEGLAIDLELKRIELARQQLESKRIELQTKKALVRQRLAQLTNLDSVAIAQLRPQLEQWKSPLPPEGVDNRPEMQALDEAIKAAEFKKRSEQSSYIPKVVAFGKKELRDDALSAFDPNWYVGVGLRWNLFDGLTGWRDIEKARLEEQKLKHRRSDVGEKLALRYNQARLELRQARQQLRVAGQRIETARDAWQLSRRQYRAGLVSHKEHLEAVKDLEEARLDQLKAIYNQRQAIVGIYEAAGQLSPETL